MRTSFGACLLSVGAFRLEPAHYPALHACLWLQASFHNAVAYYPHNTVGRPLDWSQKVRGGYFSKYVFASILYGTTDSHSTTLHYSLLIDLQPNTPCISVRYSRVVRCLWLVL